MSYQTGLTKGYAIAIAATAVWSTTAVFIRYLNVNYSLPPLVLAFWRDLFAAAALAIVTFLVRPKVLSPGWSTWKFLVLYGLVLTFFNATWTISVFYNGAAVSTVLAYSSGAFTAVLGWRLFHERLDWIKLVAVALSLAGCILVSGAYQTTSWNINPIGVMTGLASGLMMAFYSLMGRWASFKKIHPFTSLTYTFAIAALCLFVLNLLPVRWDTLSGSLLSLGPAFAGWMVLFILAVGPTVGGYGLYTLSLMHLPASVANLIATLEPALTAVLAYFFLSEVLSLSQIGGSILILSGVLFLRPSESRYSKSMEHDVVAIQG